MSGRDLPAQAVHEHEFEAAHGLPEPLPPGERLLWQGGPDWRHLARHGFHLNKLAVYFAALLAGRAATVAAQGGTAGEAVLAAAWLLPLALAGLGLVGLLAWLSARTTVYTLTSRRVVMRVGIVLSVTFNLPYRAIEAAGLKTYRDGSGDIPLSLGGRDRIAWLQLWPHARPWRVKRPEPMLRSVPEAGRVAALLSQAWSIQRQLPVAERPAELPAALPPDSAAAPRHTALPAGLRVAR